MRIPSKLSDGMQYKPVLPSITYARAYPHTLGMRWNISQSSHSTTINIRIPPYISDGIEYKPFLPTITYNNKHRHTPYLSDGIQYKPILYDKDRNLRSNESEISTHTHISY